MFRDYINYAANGTSIWRFVASLFVVSFIWILGTLVALLPIFIIAFLEGAEPDTLEQDLARLMNASEPSWRGQIFVMLIFASVATLWIGAFLIQMIMRLPFGALLSFIDRLRWGRMFRAAAVATLVFSSVIALNIALEWQSFTLSDHLPQFLLGTLLLAPIIWAQATGEEVIFRGWFVQQLSRVWKNPAFLWLIPGLIFTALHMGNPEVLSAGHWVLIFHLLFSLLMFWTVRRDGGLEVAFALHWVNNMFVLPIRPMDMPESYMGQFVLLEYVGSFSNEAVGMALQLITQLLMLLLVLVLLYARPSPLRLDR